MNHKSTFMYFNAAYLFGLVCFAILLYLEIKNIFLTNFIIIASIILLIIKIVYWHSVNKVSYEFIPSFTKKIITKVEKLYL